MASVCYNLKMATTITPKRKNFKELVPFFDQVSHTNFHKDLMKTVIQNLALKNNMLGLEIGSGTGCLSFQICQSHKIIMHCTDSLQEMLTQGEISYPHHQIVRSRLDMDTMMPPVRENFDFAVGSLVFHLFGNKQKSLKFLHSILRPSAQILFLTQSQLLNREMAEKWVQTMQLSDIEKELVLGMTNSGLQNGLLSNSEISSLFENSGFTQIKITPVGFENSLILIHALRSPA